MSFAVTLRAPSILSVVCCSTVTGRWKNFPLNDKRRQNATICVTLILSRLAITVGMSVMRLVEMCWSSNLGLERDKSRCCRGAQCASS